MAVFLYNLLLLVFSPVALVCFLWRVFVARKSNESWRQNLGALPEFASRPAGRKLVWLHAVSVGEVVASLPVLDELRRRLPDAVILVTTITQTGNAVAKKSAKAADAVSYLPLDYPVFINRALNRVRPDAIVVMEAEMWPNFLAAARRRGVPAVLVNGRVSDRSMRRGRSWRWLISWTLSNLDYCYMQTQTDAERIRELGARPESVRVCGSTKFDQEGGKLADDAMQALRADLDIPSGTPVLVAGSTNPGEDEPVLEAFRKVRNGAGDLRLIMAPRQVERADEIQLLAEARGLRCARRSEKRSAAKDYDVLILDSFGELASVYAVGDVTFVGGTLIPKGGHSIIQPILQGKPVLFGPHTFKTRDIAQIALSAGVGFEVGDADELAERAKALLADPSRRAEIDAACGRLVSENLGAAAGCAELIVGLLDRRAEVAGAS